MFCRKHIPLHLLVLSLLTLAACRSGREIPPRAVVRDGVAITLTDQKLSFIRKGRIVRDYKISSSKFGMGNRAGSNCTPLGIHAVTGKIGEGQPSGMVFKGCKPTGEIVSANSGRDPIVTRVIPLAGLERSNRNSHDRRIYIHGTPEERLIGYPASYGCIRMRSADVLDLFSRVHRGTPVAIERCSQSTYMKAGTEGKKCSVVIPRSLVASLPTDQPHSYTPISSGRLTGSRSHVRNSRKSRAQRALTVASGHARSGRKVRAPRRAAHPLALRLNKIKKQ